MNKRTVLRWFLPLFILALALAAGWSMMPDRASRQKPPPKEKVWQVAAIPARLQALAPRLTLYGQVESSALLKAAAPGTGVIERLLVQPGDRVHPGQLLLKMDARDFLAAQSQAKADVAEVKAQLSELVLKHQASLQALQQEQTLLKLQQQAVHRIERLKKNRLSSETALSNAYEKLGQRKLSLIAKRLEVERYTDVRRQLEARLARMQARLQLADLSLQRSRISADFDGVVAQVSVSAGERVRNGDPLLSLYALDSLRLRASIPVRYQAEIGQALGRGEKLTAQGSLSGHHIALQLIRLAGKASLGGIDGYFHIVSGGANLRLGNLLRIELLRPRQPDVIAIPFTAIYGNNRIFVLRNGRMVALDVESVGQYQGSQQQSRLLIRSPLLKPDDRIITTHLPNAVDGLKVRVVGE